MYQLPVYMGRDVKVNPAPIMYSLPNYHVAAVDNCSDDNDIEITDPVALIELKQADLLGRLLALNIKLDSYLKTQGDSKKSKGVSPIDAVAHKKTPNASAPNDTTKKDKDKDAKKEARKAAKNEAKTKAADPTANPVAKKSVKGNVSNNWIVTEDKPSTETGQSLTSCTKQNLVSFAQENFGIVTLSIQAQDIPWVKAFSKVAETRNVSFEGAYPNRVEKAATTITVTEGDNFCLTLKNMQVTKRSTTWKMLGTALGIYSFIPQQSINATHQQLWLEKAESVLHKELDVNLVIRDISKFLSTFDGLGAQFSFGAADIILRSLLPSGNYPNNVELWVRRIDAL